MKRKNHSNNKIYINIRLNNINEIILKINKDKQIISKILDFYCIRYWNHVSYMLILCMIFTATILAFTHAFETFTNNLEFFLATNTKIIFWIATVSITFILFDPTCVTYIHKSLFLYQCVIFVFSQHKINFHCIFDVMCVYIYAHMQTTHMYPSMLLLCVYVYSMYHFFN